MQGDNAGEHMLLPRSAAGVTCPSLMMLHFSLSVQWAAAVLHPGQCTNSWVGTMHEYRPGLGKHQPSPVVHMSGMSPSPSGQ